jgi:hypothetical protein
VHYQDDSSAQTCFYSGLLIVKFVQVCWWRHLGVSTVAALAALENVDCCVIIVIVWGRRGRVTEQLRMWYFFSAYHGHLTTLIDISHYKFSLPGGPPQKDHVHVVRLLSLSPLTPQTHPRSSFRHLVLTLTEGSTAIAITLNATCPDSTPTKSGRFATKCAKKRVKVFARSSPRVF